MNTTRNFVFMGLLISMQIVLTRFLSIQTPIVRIGFVFLPIVLSSIMFGPFWGGITAMLSDILGMIIFPQGAYFPGFTLDAFLSGVIYGIILYKKPKNIVNITIAVLIVMIFVDLGLNTLWLSMITGKAVTVLFLPRFTKSIIMLPVQIFLIHIVWKYISRSIPYILKNQTSKR